MARTGHLRCFLVILLAIACDVEKGSEIHLIPEGYVGPVVILYAVPGGADVQRDERGAIIYRIPADGVLRLKMSAPAAGFYDEKYYYEAADGARKPLLLQGPNEVAPNVLQVFALVGGATGMIGGIPADDQRSTAYVVGVPSDRSDWVELRDKATKEAILSLTRRKR